MKVNILAQTNCLINLVLYNFSNLAQKVKNDAIKRKKRNGKLL